MFFNKYKRLEKENERLRRERDNLEEQKSRAFAEGVRRGREKAIEMGDGLMHLIDENNALSLTCPKCREKVHYPIVYSFLKPKE